jgi:hypothetical protein
MRRLRAAAGWRAPTERLAELRARVAELEDENRRLRVTIAMAGSAHPNPGPPSDPTRGVAPKRRGPRLPCPRPIPDQRDPDPGEVWPARHGIRIPPQRLRQPRREGQG